MAEQALPGIRWGIRDPAINKIYLAIRWPNREEPDHSELSIMVTTRHPRDVVRPRDGIEYFMEWKAAAVWHGSYRWVVHNNLGWLGAQEANGLKMVAWLADIDPNRVVRSLEAIDTAICDITRAAPVDQHGIDDPIEALFLEKFAMMAEEPGTVIQIPQPMRRAIRTAARDIIASARAAVRAYRGAEAVTANPNAQPWTSWLLATDFRAIEPAPETSTNGHH
ncbi:hypothetical protein GGR50DRAFT_691013 [Xylaria sp. CBS 124048]|nr:hypothetical protein GGR50DRAFT_691013 [Xylaria sp. CBS 124048]